MSVLTFLAAAIPIAGSLYVAVSFLIHQSQLAYEERVRFRVAERVDDIRQAILSGEAPAAPDWKAGSARYAELKKQWLGYYGIEPTLGSYRAMDIAAGMSAPRLPRREVERQWVLLLSSTAGLVLLALDGLTA